MSVIWVHVVVRSDLNVYWWDSCVLFTTIAILDLFCCCCYNWREPFAVVHCIGKHFKFIFSLQIPYILHHITAHNILSTFSSAPIPRLCPDWKTALGFMFVGNLCTFWKDDNAGGLVIRFVNDYCHYEHCYRQVENCVWNHWTSIGCRSWSVLVLSLLYVLWRI